MQRVLICEMILASTMILLGCAPHAEEASSWPTEGNLPATGADVGMTCSRDNKGRLVLDLHRYGPVKEVCGVLFWIEGATYSWGISQGVSVDPPEVGRIVYGVLPLPHWVQRIPENDAPPIAIPDERVFYVETKFLALWRYDGTYDLATAEATAKFRSRKGGIIEYLGKAGFHEGLGPASAPAEATDSRKRPR